MRKEIVRSRPGGNMNQAETFHLKVLNMLSTYSTEKVDKYLISLFKGDRRDKDYWKEVYRQYDYPCYFYQYLACAVKVLGAKQVVEIGADRGTSAIIMASEGAKVLSVDIRDGWEHAKGKDLPIQMIKGDSLDQELFDGYNLSETDLWLIDGLHTYPQVSQELAFYQKFFKTGAIVLLDDVNEYKEICSNILSDWILSYDIHLGGVGVVWI